MVKQVQIVIARILMFSIMLCCLACTSNPKQIGIQPYGAIDHNMLNTIAETLKETYNVKIVVLDEKALPKSAFVKIKRPRYRADSLLKDLKKQRHDSIDFILGITSKDISTTKRAANGTIKKPESKYSDWGVFGLGYRPGKACVISTFRLKHANAKTYLDRIQKIAIHEIGHNLGLHHCPNTKCVMQDAVETIKTVDSAGFELCEDCKSQIR